MNMSILVFGSINMDLVARVPRLPLPGETLTGNSFVSVPGGKGANQAVACARLGMQTRLVGRVGEDVFGGSLRDHLQKEGVLVEGVGTAAGTPSGVAVIAVSEQGENVIIVIPGANGIVGDADLDHLRSVIDGARVLLLQLEVPMDTVVKAARLGRAHGMTVILDPAPAKPLPDELYPLVDILTPNMTEAGILAGHPVESVEDAKQAAQVLHRRGVTSVIVKMGGEGAYSLTEKEGKHWAPFKVRVVDTVAAGDAFNGALAVAVCEGRLFHEAMLWGMAGGALAVTKPGAQEAMPYREELLRLLEASPRIP